MRAPVGTKLHIVRHFEEENDLTQTGRDAKLVPGQENKATRIAEDIYSQLIADEKRAVLFVTSPKIRATQTAEMIADAIRSTDGRVKFRFAWNDNLRSFDQGRFILPRDYKAGDQFAGLVLAERCFFDETHGGRDHFGYRFGDPLLLPDGTYKYPELRSHFVEYGESYEHFLRRIYFLVVQMSVKFDKLSGPTRLVVITHGLPFRMIKGLEIAAAMLKRSGVQYQPSHLFSLCETVYRQHITSPAASATVSLNDLADPEMIVLLKREITLLSKIRILARE